MNDFLRNIDSISRSKLLFGLTFETRDEYFPFLQPIIQKHWEAILNPDGAREAQNEVQKMVLSTLVSEKVFYEKFILTFSSRTCVLLVRKLFQNLYKF